MVSNDITGSVTWDTMSYMRNISEMALLWLQIKNATKEYEVQWYVIPARQIDAA